LGAARSHVFRIKVKDYCFSFEIFEGNDFPFITGERKTGSFIACFQHRRPPEDIYFCLEYRSIIIEHSDRIPHRFLTVPLDDPGVIFNSGE
jgi:hypothetical protein